MSNINRPTDETRKFLMRRARGKTECKDNRFYISCETGEIVSSVYLQGNGDYAAHIPKNTYEIGVSYEPFLSYNKLDEYIAYGMQMNEAGY